MRISIPLPRWVLSQGEMLRIRNARGVEIRCRSGRVWITEQGNVEDVWLAPDGTHTCTRRGLTLIGAESDCVLEFSYAARWRWSGSQGGRAMPVMQLQLAGCA